MAGGRRPPPGLILRTVVPRHWSERTIILLVMQSLDNSITVLRAGAAGSDGCG